jgi:uncharacterized protein (DUF342 family)
MDETKRPDFYVQLTPDNTKVIVGCPISNNLELLAKRIQRQVVSLKISCTLTAEQIIEILQNAPREGGRVDDLVLIQGEEPVQPIEGKIVWTADYFNDSFMVDDETGSIDYRRRMAQRSVNEAQLLATVTFPVEGRDGRDVFNKTIPVSRVKQIKIRSGANVRFDESTGQFYAAASGQIRWDEERGVLSVDTIYVVGNVNLESGNIEHPGSLVVEGDVKSGTKVTVGGNIEVKGTLEAADVNCGGNLVVRGGVMGLGKSFTVGGSVHAKFILDATIRAQGDIVVEKEIVQSNVYTRGSVSVLAGRCVGGEIVALGQITVAQAGSEGQINTNLISGEDYLLEEELAQLQEQIAAHEETINKIQAATAPLLDRLKMLPQDKRETIGELLSRVDSLKGLVAGIHGTMEQKKAESAEKAKPLITIRKIVYPEVVLGMGKERMQVIEPFRGPGKASLSKGRRIVLQVSSR